MDSGAYTIQEFICQSCEAYLGWKFVRAHDGPERWKEGHYILELDLVLEHDAPRSPSSAYAPDEADASPVETDAAQQAAEAAGLHKRTLSSDPRPPKGVGQGHRSLQVGAAKQQKTPTPGQRKLEVDDYDGGPFWKPR